MHVYSVYAGIIWYDEWGAWDNFSDIVFLLMRCFIQKLRAFSIYLLIRELVLYAIAAQHVANIH